MSTPLFRQHPLIQRSVMQKVLGQHPEDNAIIELNNLLSAKPILQIDKKDVLSIEERYKLRLIKEYKLNLEEFYAVYLNQCLSDRVLSKDELEALKHLKKLLSLDDHTIENLHERVGGIVYQQSFEEAVADGRLNKEEKEFLTDLETQLRIPRELAEKISREARTRFMEDHVSKVINDRRLSPMEEKELKAISESLQVNITDDEQTASRLEKLKYYWSLENLELPTITPAINIQKSEQCYFQLSDVKWFETRSSRGRKASGSYSSGQFFLQGGTSSPYHHDSYTLIDTGKLFLTNKRIIFVGVKKNSNIRLEKILSIAPQLDGVEIDKETGKSPRLRLSKNADVFCIILERLLKEI